MVPLGRAREIQEPQLPDYFSAAFHAGLPCHRGRRGPSVSALPSDEPCNYRSSSTRSETWSVGRSVRSDLIWCANFLGPVRTVQVLPRIGWILELAKLWWGRGGCAEAKMTTISHAWLYGEGSIDSIRRGGLLHQNCYFYFGNGIWK